MRSSTNVHNWVVFGKLVIMTDREAITPEGASTGEIVASESGSPVRVGLVVGGEGVPLGEGVEGVYG